MIPPVDNWPVFQNRPLSERFQAYLAKQVISTLCVLQLFGLFNLTEVVLVAWNPSNPKDRILIGTTVDTEKIIIILTESPVTQPKEAHHEQQERNS